MASTLGLTTTKGAGPAVPAVLGGTATLVFVVDIFLRQRDVALTLAAGVICAAAVALAARGRTLAQRLALFLAFGSVAGILAVTIVPDTGYSEIFLVDRGWRWGELMTWWRTGWADIGAAIGTGIDGPYNIVLFVPAGTMWAWVTRRPVATVAALGLLSVSIESFQAVTGFRTGQTSDLVANILGAAGGALLATAARHWMSALARGREPRHAHRSG